MLKKSLIVLILMIVSIILINKIFFDKKNEKKVVVLSKYEQRYDAIKDIIENYNKNSKETNYYYCKKNFNNNLTQNVWRKGDICLVKLTDDKKSIIMLVDGLNNKTYQIDEINKTYEIINNSNIDVFSLPKYDFINFVLNATPDVDTYKYLAEAPKLKIESGSYKDIECYIISYENTKVYHNKKDGIPIASFTDDILNTETNYSIGEVTDSDIQIDLNKYKKK